FLNAPTMMESFRDVAAIVRKGGAVLTEEGTMAPEHPVWVEFARSMEPMMARPAEMMAGLIGADSGASWKVLDVAAGHGLFGIAIGRRNPNARIAALDWAAVLDVARENAQKSGIADRYETIPGSAFDVDYGSGYDFVLLTNFLHHFDPATCEVLL